ncbi:hypothetical protein N658DRAFT_500971 [Parathielavia hyrcaniae]|uniref:Uncharacterized protein n=1 Tax=Parathielavia hyrcaniae TaxID=113614 RepID=A0AAN6PTX3_9PEZI|nr:hypothetical protein N658DRAFT_500971 [Parathielavia hyrcaniae]
MILAEVFLQRKRERFSEIFNFDLASVSDVIYRGPSSIPRILAASRPEHLTEDKIRCRWFHVPSNNEQWVHDLMVSMGIQDGSMGGQRHEGSRIIDRYMMPQARRYKHFHGSINTPQPEPRPRATRFGSTDSAATVVLGSRDLPPTLGEVRGKKETRTTVKDTAPEFTRTEADAVAIFMPILGFEKHRHRKYLTQAFQEADQAMRIARARDSSPDPKAPADRRSAVFQKANRRRGAESSDDGDSSERETSRLYPLVQPATRAKAQITQGREAQLLRGYLDSKQVKPVHCRRTLDQFSYYMLNSTEARDKGQVAYRWARNPAVCAEPKNRPIVMVDQLWLWAFHDGTIITSAPNTWNGQEEFNFSNVVVRELRYNKDRHIIRSVEDLLHLILKSSVDFFRRKGPVNFQFHECFQSSINNVSEQQGRLFDSFRNTTKKLHIGALEPVERKKEIEFLFSLDQETELLVEIMDIQDELTIVKTILAQQHDVLEKLLRLYPKKADEDADEETRAAALPGGMGKGELMVLRNLVQLLRDQNAVATDGSGLSPVTPGPSFRDTLQASELGAAGGQLGRGPRPKAKQKDAEQARATALPAKKTNILQNRDLMYETIGIVENNMRIITDMLAYAEKVESSLENLLDLKQKHANGWEARFAREGSEESQRQGNIILVFTLVTVVFLPLSFITSFFALEIDIFPKSAETDETLWPVGQVSGYLFGFSAVIFIPLIVLALYVNKLIANIKQTYKQLLKALKDPDTALNPPLPKDTADHDSDEERTFVDRRTFANTASDRYGFRTNRAASQNIGEDIVTSKVSSKSSSDDDSDLQKRSYAPLFGRYYFHTAIPLLRGLWKYRRYRLHSARPSGRQNRWRDRYVDDYPLQYYRTKATLAAVRGLVSVLAWCGSEKYRRAMARDHRRRRKAKREGLGSSTDSDGSSSSDSAGGASSHGGGVERKDFGLGARKLGGMGLKMVGAKRKGPKRKRSLDSLYWKQGTGLVGNGSREADLGDMERWSNQTRSRGSFDLQTTGDNEVRGADEGEMPAAGKAGRLAKLGWLRLRRKGRARGVVDEEKEIGAAEGLREKG